MPTYAYKAKSRCGETVTGSVEADSENHAAGKIREMGALPMDIRQIGAGAEVSNGPAGSAFARYLVYPIWTGVNIRALLFFFRQMATLLAAGMSLSEALGSVSTRQRGRLGRIIREMRDAVVHGGRLSEVMARYPRVFSPLQLSLVQVGESGGLIEQMMDRIASYLEYEISVRRMISKVMFYPILILLAIVFIPHLPALVLGSGKAFLHEIWAADRKLFWFMVIAVIAAKLLFQFGPVRLVWDVVKVVPPVIGTVARKIAMSRFSKALAILYSAGLPIAQAVSVAADACANLYISRSIKSAVPAIQAGEGLTASLARTGCILPMVMDMLATGEKTGSMDAVLNKVATYMDEEADATIHKLGIALFVLMILVAGGIVLYMLVGSYSEYANKATNPN